MTILQATSTKASSGTTQSGRLFLLELSATTVKEVRPPKPFLDEIFATQPMAHWYEVFNGVHVTFGAVRGPQEVINDPQLAANDIVVPLEGAGGKLTSTISSPIQVHGVAKVPARRAPDLGEHTEKILQELGFDAKDIDALRASGTVPKAKERAA